MPKARPLTAEETFSFLAQIAALPREAERVAIVARTLFTPELRTPEERAILAENSQAFIALRKSLKIRLSGSQGWVTTAA